MANPHRAMIMTENRLRVERWFYINIALFMIVLGPLLDRIDLHIQVPAVKYKELAEDEKSEESAAIRERILAARQSQSRRLEPFGIFCNAQMTPRTLRR